MTSDEALMLEFQRGSREAFDELFERYRRPLYGYFRRRLQSRERAEDLTQDAFLAVLRATERYQPRALVRTYLYGIALKLLAAERRKLARVEPPADPICDSRADETLWVRQALEKIEPVEREILMLREYEQLSYEEIAEVLGYPTVADEYRVGDHFKFTVWRASALGCFAMRVTDEERQDDGTYRLVREKQAVRVTLHH